MAEGEFRLRIRYSKGGRLIYLSHLDTIRCIERCIRRAGLPFAVTQGFSPHMKKEFGWALPVGVSSLDEYFDVILTEFVEPAEVLHAFEGEMPAGLAVLDAFYADPRGESLEAAFPCSRYTCVFAGEEESVNGLPAALEELLARGSMVVRRKKKEKTVEFAPLLRGKPRLELRPDGTASMTLTTFTEGKGSLRPDLFCAELVALRPGVRVASITREAQLPA